MTKIELTDSMTDKKEPYKSKEGFVIVPVRRGFTEISFLWDWLSKLRDKYENRYKWLVCGGYVRYMCSPDPTPAKASDVDIYSSDEEAYEILKKEFENESLSVRHENNISITYKRPEDLNHNFFNCPVLQVIKPVEEGAIVAKGSMEDILKNFDFTVIRGALVKLKLILNLLWHLELKEGLML